MSDFDRAITIVLDFEGGEKITDDPNDPGGLTKYGISQRAYPNENIRELTLERAEALYRRDYWNAAHCDKMQWPVNLIVFDSAVNQGVGTAIRILQRALRLYEDGIVGPVTLAAARRATHRHCAVIIAQRLLHYQKSSRFHLYGGGWYTRCTLLAMEAGRE